jgi:hypothetical protein
MRGPPERFVSEGKNRASFLSLVLQFYIYMDKLQREKNSVEPSTTLGGPS